MALPQTTNDQGVEFFVVPGGDDLNPGTAELPLASLTRASDAIRAFSGYKSRT